MSEGGKDKDKKHIYTVLCPHCDAELELGYPKHDPRNHEVLYMCAECGEVIRIRPAKRVSEKDEPK